MGSVDVIIIALVVSAAAYLLWDLLRPSGKYHCVGCASADDCSVARTGKGRCPAAEQMALDAERAARRRKGR
ncbi:MAG: hypothetical protein WAY93_07145 [Atopobiaceae bacterium]|jgi:hypothetical protein